MTVQSKKQSIKERCLCCTTLTMAISMKFIARTGHWICRECFSSVESGLPMVEAQLGYEWSKKK